MKIKNKAILIAYPNRLGSNLADLENILNGPLKNAFGGVHILPFYHSSGDAGFAPIDYEVDEAFGSWNDIEKIAAQKDVMVDFMVNHLSPDSSEFQDYVKYHQDSKFKDMFLNWSKFWPKNRPTQADIDLIYKRKDRAPYQEIMFADGKTEKIWNTFGEKQLDLDVTQKTAQDFIHHQVSNLIQHGAKIVRLDAFAYAIKKLDTSDFFVEPEVWQLLEDIANTANKADALVLPEIHEHYSYNKKIVEKGYFSYDFVLPIVVLHALYSHQGDALVSWLNQASMHQFTTLDTHDGIGVVDGKGILSDEQLDYTVNRLYEVGANVKRAYSSSAYHNLDIYQLNTTFYSAVGNSDAAYLLARAIQIFAPGIPQIYYVGLLAGKNDIDLVEETKEGRDINRHFYDQAEINSALQKPVVAQLLKLLEYRNTSAAFELTGKVTAKLLDDGILEIVRSNEAGCVKAILHASLNNYHFSINEITNETSQNILVVGEN
ncbi:sucrose phosphorylase [Ligilactobacillus sp. WILCCON 0076]|uniref:Sucrose phosphorylase n=2 Tax=Lactobacillaceae TaxID=33958 RepID=A0A9X2JLJ5_9LACO|nr:sucrose phosphorylase [Ligilactobacillus ubinensis]MCP0886665.1 sucrose phosphorylase [Ligilactobacillus ubinensis]